MILGHKWGDLYKAQLHESLFFLKQVQFCVGQICEEPVCKFLACLEQHALVRELSSSTFYWVCAYANNQHCVEEDIKSNPRSTSFYKAMQMSEGVLLVLDSAGTPFERIWCCFEEAIAAALESLAGARKLHEMCLYINMRHHEDGFYLL